MGSVAADFGAEGGTPIVNRDSILASVDAALGCDGPPAIEYLFVAPFGSTTFLGEETKEEHDRVPLFSFLKKSFTSFLASLIRSFFCRDPSRLSIRTLSYSVCQEWSVDSVCTWLQIAVGIFCSDNDCSSSDTRFPTDNSG